MRGFTIRLETPGFGRDPEQFSEFVRNGLRDLTMANVYAYQHDPLLPSIKDAGVEYRREPPGNEQFKDVVAVLHDGYGDCEDLACAQAAWRTVRTGELCSPAITWKPMGSGWLYHITVLRADGTREDPSRELGMNHEPGEWRLRGALWVYELFEGRTGVRPASVPARTTKERAA
ncbi:MAG TPA: hypothetical protein VGP93_13275 [Polyangiaceae bacterium]|jgi:hypothetical protein|nr:hypothetical protein [Polyangiaceae bacterium]